MDPQSYYDQIEDYLQDELSPQARKAFEHALERDSELARQLALERALLKTLQEEPVRKFRASVKQALEESRTKKRPKPAFRRSLLVLSIAASILMVLAAIWWGQTTQPSLSSSALAATFLTQYDPGVLPLEPGTRTNEDSLKVELFRQVAPEWKKLDSLYASGDFRTAMAQLQRLGSMDPGRLLIAQNTLTYYTGMCQLRLGDTEAGLANLEQVQSPFSEKATFFRAIALLKLDRKEEAKPLLESIAGATAHPFKEPAGVLLKRY